MAVHDTVQRAPVQLSADLGEFRKITAPPQRTFLTYGTVGHTDDIAGTPEPTPQYVRLEGRQVFVEVTVQPDGDEIVARLGNSYAGNGVGQYTPLEFGCRVILEMVRGNPQKAVVVARCWDQKCAIPDTVAGISTGAAPTSAPGVTAPAPMWLFTKTGLGQLVALETGVGGDYVLHVGDTASGWVQVPLPGALHLDATVHLGGIPATPPIGATVGPAGTVIPGVPMVPRAPISKLPVVSPGGPALPDTSPDNNAIVRSKDSPVSDVTIDPTFWTWLAAAGTVLAGLGVVPPIPISLTSDHRSASRHTASD